MQPAVMERALVLELEKLCLKLPLPPKTCMIEGKLHLLLGPQFLHL